MYNSFPSFWLMTDDFTNGKGGVGRCVCVWPLCVCVGGRVWPLCVCVTGRVWPLCVCVGGGRVWPLGFLLNVYERS